MKNENYITIHVNELPFVTILEPFKTFKQAAKKAQYIVDTSERKLSFSINTPLTREIQQMEANERYKIRYFEQASQKIKEIFFEGRNAWEDATISSG